MIAKYRPVEQESTSVALSPSKYTSLISEGIVPETGIVKSVARATSTPLGDETFTAAQDLSARESVTMGSSIRMRKLYEEARSLREEKLEKIATEHQMVGQVLSDQLAPFLLEQIIEKHAVELRVLNDNLTAPYGWLAIGKLLQARLIDCLGEMIIPTTAGVQFLEWYLQDQHDSDASVDGE